MKTDTEMTAVYSHDISAILESASEKDNASNQSLLQMLRSDPAAFCRASVGLLAGAPDSDGSRYLVNFLRKYNQLSLFVEALTDPSGGCSLDKAIAVARVVTQIDASVENKVEHALTVALQRAPSQSNARCVLYVVDLLAAVSAPGLFLLFQDDLMAYPDSAVRSKAALLIARSSKNASLVGRLLRDPDIRVQANAVEALWDFEPAACRPLLNVASKSRQNRVAGNAVIGLYRIAEVGSIRLLFEMARRDDPRFRMTAIWAMGETGDPRFLPFLTEQVQQRTGKERLGVLRALTRIRRRERALAEAGPVEIRVHQSVIEPDGRRRLLVALQGPQTYDWSSVKPTQFAVSEGSTPIQDYAVTAINNPALLMIGFITPRFLSGTDPYGLGIVEAFGRCTKFKRPDDLWRIDRYALQDHEPGPALTPDKTNFPYGEEILGPNAKTQRGFLSGLEQLNKLIGSPGPRECAAADTPSAVQRVDDAMSQLSGTRHIFLFLHADCLKVTPPDGQLEKLAASLRNERIALHGVAPDSIAGLEIFRDLCLASDGGTFAGVPMQAIPDTLENLYSQLLNKFEITYPAPANGDASVEATLLLSSDFGAGRATFSLAKANG